MKRYIKTEWIDDRTPVNAKNLNKIEDALETLSIDSLDISKIQGVNGIKVVTKDDGGVEISGNIQVVPEVEGQSYDTGKVYFVLDPSNQKVKGLVVAGEFTKLGGEGDGTGDSPLGRVTFRVTTLEDTLGTLETRIGDLESRPVAKAVDLEPVNTRIGSLETKVQGLEETEIPGIKTRLGVIESRPGVNLEPVNTKIGQLENRIGTLESRPGTDNSLVERVASLESTKNELVSKDSNLEGRTIPDIQPITDRVTALENAPKPVDKSHDIAELQRKVAEHTTSISNNVRRISALEGKANTSSGDNSESNPNPQSLPSDLVRLADIEDVVRKSTLFDTEHNTILPELLPEIDTVVKWMKGKGRPDKPETTENVIQGDEADLTRYISTDGAGTGAWEWEKRGGTWKVVRGDTGWRKIKSGALENSSSILIRRTESQVDVQFYNEGNWGIVKFKPFSKATKRGGQSFELYIVGEGFRGCMAVICPLYDDDTLTQIGGINFNTQLSGGGHIMTARFASGIDKEKVPSVRPGLFNFPTIDPWPSKLPGDPFDACPAI